MYQQIPEIIPSKLVGKWYFTKSALSFTEKENVDISTKTWSNIKKVSGKMLIYQQNELQATPR